MGNKFCGEATRWVVSYVGRPPDGSKFCGGGHQMGNKFCGEAT